ncbi:hypothetical protein T439DRAFT_380736 [Meredithblackwellia eburnea MCA 4105]
MPPTVTAPVASTSSVGPAYQPFQCPTCLKRFTRHENLKRHAALHVQTDGNTFPCEYCSVSFARQDLRRRHVANKHPEHTPPSAAASSGSSKGSRTRGSNTKTTSQSKKDGASLSPPEMGNVEGDAAGQGLQLTAGGASVGASGAGVGQDPQSNLGSWDFEMFSHTSADGLHGIASGLGSIPAAEVDTFFSNLNNPTLPDYSAFSHPTAWPQMLGSQGPTAGNGWPQGPQNSISPPATKRSPSTGGDLPEVWQPSFATIARGVELFFQHLSPSFPFLHQPTFNPSESALHLVLSVCCLGFQFGDDPAIEGLASPPGRSGDATSQKCYQSASELMSRMKEKDKSLEPSDKLVMVQTYLLLQMYAFFHLGDDGQEDEDSGSVGLRFHSKMIRLSRSSGLMQPLPTNPSSTSDLESLWREFIKAESHKRTMLTLHHVDSLLYQLFSTPRQVSHLEIKHDMPCPASLWAISSSAEWAHRTLLSKNATPTVRYAEAIRRFIYPSDSPESLPMLELQGAINVIHFLQTSLREVSGYSTMVGRVSLERLEALNASLTSMEPFIRARERGPTWVIVEATWQMARLETLLWSSSHMGGIVESTVEGAMATATQLAASQDFILDAEVARSLIVHVDWFLVYLEGTQNPDKEPAYITIYAFKAFLIAFQLLGGSAPAAMNAVGINDGDKDAALEWAKRKFQLRRRWKVGRLASDNLDALALQTRGA